MKPNFALSLSFEGISLLYRVENGWHLLGEADLASADLAGELEALRAAAEALEGPDFRTKLILPNDQIKYLALDTGRGTRKKRLTLAAEALEAETPYTADQLAFDIAADGRLTHVAAVARETLAEAEAFAVEHRFNPVSFAAIPGEQAFPQEPFLGPTQCAADFLGGAEAEADETPIAIISSGPLAPKPPESLPVPQPEPQSEPEPEPLPEPVAEPEPLPEITESEAPVAKQTEDEAKEATPDASANEAPPTEAVTGFSSIRARRDAPVESPAPKLGSAVASAKGTNAPGLPLASESGAHSRETLRFDPSAAIAGLRATDEPETEEKVEDKAAPSSFFSRRSAQKPEKKAPSSEIATPQPETKARPMEEPASKAPKFKALRKSKEKPPKAKGSSERRNMTVFGERDGNVGGKPRHLGLILTLVLLLFLAGVAVWASLFLDDGVAGIFRREPVPQIAELEMESTPVEVDQVETNALEPVDSNSLTDSAEIEAMTDSAVAEAIKDTEDDTELTDSAAVEALQDAVPETTLTPEARYAVSGIWEQAPLQPDTPESGSTDTLYLTSIDRALAARDAVALPDAELANNDLALARLASPPPPGTKFDLDDRGLVKATPQGAMSPDGVMVYLGKPPVLPKTYPVRKPSPGESFTPEMIVKLGKLRPKLRPDDLVEKNERASFGGRSLTELAKLRPRLRPASAKAEAEKDTTPTEAAVTASLRPRQRPANMAQLVARATPTEPVVATPVSATVTPSIPTTASVARQATIQNALNLNKINLIGVYGTSSSRRALVRFANGRLKKVQVGDRIDGGKVSAISDTELRYVKSGRNIILKMPKG